MDLKELWNKPEAQTQADPERKALEVMLSGQSRGILSKLRRKLLLKIGWGAAIGLTALVLILLQPSNNGILFLMGFMIFMVLLLGSVLVRYYFNLPNRLDMDREVLPVMKEYNQLIRSALRFEERVGALFIIPSPAIGAIASMISDNDPIGESLTDWKFLLILVVVTIAFAPIGIKMARWMNKVAFGKYLDQLSSNIAALENIESEK